LSWGQPDRLALSKACASSCRAGAHALRRDRGAAGDEGRLHAGELDAGLALANVERATARASLGFGNRVANLGRLGGIALLVGLLGTVVSLMSSLQVIGALAAPTIHDFVAGILQALVCSALGLLVALFCFVAFFCLDARLTRGTLAVRDIAEDLVCDAAENDRRA
jgi:biopolymer transport protein ExbB/TolQ